MKIVFFLFLLLWNKKSYPDKSNVSYYVNRNVYLLILFETG